MIWKITLGEQICSLESRATTNMKENLKALWILRIWNPNVINMEELATPHKISHISYELLHILIHWLASAALQELHLRTLTLF